MAMTGAAAKFTFSIKLKLLNGVTRVHLMMPGRINATSGSVAQARFCSQGLAMPLKISE